MQLLASQLHSSVISGRKGYPSVSHFSRRSARSAYWSAPGTGRSALPCQALSLLLKLRIPGRTMPCKPHEGVAVYSPLAIRARIRGLRPHSGLLRRASTCAETRECSRKQLAKHRFKEDIIKSTQAPHLHSPAKQKHKMNSFGARILQLRLWKLFAFRP